MKATRAVAACRRLSSRISMPSASAIWQILLERRSNDILTPKVHYIRLASDFSNISEVMQTFPDERWRLEITEMAGAYVMDGDTYAHRARAVYDSLTREHASLMAGGRPCAA